MYVQDSINETLNGQLIEECKIECDVQDINIRFEKHDLCLTHIQDCCEQVYIYRIDYYPKDNIAQIALDTLHLKNVIFESISKNVIDDPSWWGGKSNDDHHTWTEFKLETNKGTICIYFLGESNGYYSEDVDMILD